MQADPKFISDRVSFIKKEDRLSIIITQQVEKKQELLLLARVVGWLICGAVFVYYYTNAEESGMRRFMMVTLAFWAFFFIRFARVYAWRKWGRESILIENKILTFKRSFGKFGKANGYFLENINAFGTIAKSKTKFFSFMQEGYLSTSGERLGFDYLGKNIAFGKQLDEKETRTLHQMIAQTTKKLRSQE